MNFEKQLVVIKTKADLHAWVDSLSDGVIQGTILLEVEAEDGRHFYFNNLGEPTVERVCYMAQSYLYWLYNRAE